MGELMSKPHYIPCKDGERLVYAFIKHGSLGVYKAGYRYWVLA